MRFSDESEWSHSLTSFSIRIVMFKVMSEPNDEFPCCASVFLRRCKSVIPVLHCSTVLYTVCVRGENNSNPINLNFEIKRRCFFLLGFLCIKITWSPELFFQKRRNVFFPFLKLQLYLVLSMRYPVPRYQFAQGLAGGSQFYPQVLQSCRRCLIGFG